MEPQHAVTVTVLLFVYIFLHSSGHGLLPKQCCSTVASVCNAPDAATRAPPPAQAEHARDYAADKAKGAKEVAADTAAGALGYGSDKAADASYSLADAADKMREAAGGYRRVRFEERGRRSEKSLFPRSWNSDY